MPANVIVLLQIVSADSNWQNLSYLRPTVKQFSLKLFFFKWSIWVSFGAHYNAHTEPLFKKSGILLLNELSLYFKTQFVHQFKQGFLPSLFQGTWQLNSERRRHEDEDWRSYDMRNFPFSRLTFSDKLPLISFPKFGMLSKTMKLN